MNNPTDIKLSKWPFFLGDAILLTFGIFVYTQHESSMMGKWAALLGLLIAAMGAALAVTPYLLEYFTAVKMVETGAMVSTISQIQNLEEIARQIGGATSQWQGVQEHATRTASTAKELVGRMTTEAAAFMEFMQKANDGEKANLRLEIEKLRRAEGEWLQIIVRMLDHTYALHQAAVRSGQTTLIEQLGQFQNSCRDVARRIGLVPFIPAADDRFDPKIHESPDSQAMSVADARVRVTIATGYSYQGQLIRPALVSLQNPAPTGEVLEIAEPLAAPIENREPEKAEAEAEAEVEEQTLL
jgi:molecular chaperone GrpE (heat shock protein)